MNPIVTAVGRLNIEGNIVPSAFFGAIISARTGKPHLLAVMIMADMLYWYRPKEIRDEVTGKTREWRQKFKADLLQKSYNGYAALYGVSRGQVKEAFDLLRQLKLIRVEFRDIITPEGQTLANVMFVEPVVATLEMVLEGVVGKNIPRPPKKRGTYTEITTEITTSSSPPPPTSEEEDVEITQLPPPFDVLLSAQLQEAVKLCKLNNLNLLEQAEALKGMVKDNPAGYLLKVLRTGGFAGAAEAVKKTREAGERNAGARKIVEDAQRRGEIPPYLRRAAAQGGRP